MPTDQQEQGLIGMQSRLSDEQLRLLESTAGPVRLNSNWRHSVW